MTARTIGISITTLFVIDAIGAAMSAVFLGIVLVYYEDLFGIPHDALYFLAAFPLLFSVYDVGCLVLASNEARRRRLLRNIAFANLLYCALSLAVAYIHKDSITLLGWLYILVEVTVVAGLGTVQLRATAGSK